MKKRYNFILGLLAILTVFAISACKDPNSSDNDNSGNTSSSPKMGYRGTLTLKGLTLKGDDFETVVYVDLLFFEETTNLETGYKSYYDWSTSGYSDSSFTEGSDIGSMYGKYEVSGNSVTLKLTWAGGDVSEKNLSYTGTTTDNWNTISFTDDEFSGTLSHESYLHQSLFE